MGSTSRMELKALARQLTAIRRDLHAHPELGFEEVRTQEIVRRWLESYEFVPQTCAYTGLVVDVRPDLHEQGLTVALRADLDALPMEETTALSHRSQHQGRAHKCGHDGHTAILLGVAAVLAGMRRALTINVRLLFQPAEEGVRGGGAKVMLAEGALAGVREIYGLHNWPAYPKGDVRVTAGPMMAGTHAIEIELIGIGGHGCQPQLCRDPIVAAAAIVANLQTVVARGLGHDGGAVVSICSFHAGTTDNVIPDTARLLGTIRTFDPVVTEHVLGRVREIVQGTAQAYGVDAKLNLSPGYPLLENHPECAEAVRRVAANIVGRQRVSGRELPIAGGEDFAYYTQVVPGAYFLLGAGDGNTPGCHHPDFDFDDDLIPLGVEMFVGLVEDRATSWV